MTDQTGMSEADVMARDVEKLHAMGYAQELRRRMGGFSNFAVSFTIISVLSGALTLYYFGMEEGGPVVIVWGWLIVGAFTLIVGLGMAEISSAFPTAGGLYFWSAKLAKTNPGAWSWFTGWFNLLGQVAITAGIDYGFAFFFTAFLNMTLGYKTTAGYILIVYAGVLLLHGIINTFGVRVVAFLSDVSVWWHILGVLVIAAVLAFVPSHHAPASFVFTKFVNLSGWHSAPYVFFVGLLMAQYTFTGYDASAHMSEETLNADRAAPRGIVSSILVSIIAGWILILAITFVIPTNMHIYGIDAVQEFAPVLIWEAAIGRHGAELLLVIAFMAQAYCGMASVTANSRMLYAFSRDGAVPGHKYWHRINPRTRTPTNSIWFCVVFAFLLALPSLWSGVAYGAVTSIATIGLYIAYVLPTLLRRMQGKQWQGGSWSLGRWSPIIGVLGIAWVVVIAILFMLPEFSPVNADTFNYAPIAVAVVLLFSGGYWLFSARKWFTGPKMQGDLAGIAAIEAEFDHIETELNEVD
ncbi:MAG: amino acid permease [Acidimicrobiales bacterium]|jgi:amino acid permease (GABA permease)